MGPRIFGIIALHAPIVAVIRRGPTDWMHISRWDLETPVYEPGAWLRGTIVARRLSFAVERRRAWAETADTPPRADDDAWDEQRCDRIVMEKPRPNANRSDRLTVRGTYAAIRELHGRRTDVRYELRSGDVTRHLDHVQWAEWDARGRLLVATDDGRMQIRDGADGSVRWEADEGAFEPDPTPPPAEASTW